MAEQVRDELVVLVAEEVDEPVDLTGATPLTDLGLNSLLLARLLIALEARLGLDPFGSGRASIADVRTVDDLIGAYVSARPDRGGHVSATSVPATEHRRLPRAGADPVLQPRLPAGRVRHQRPRRAAGHRRRRGHHRPGEHPVPPGLVGQGPTRRPAAAPQHHRRLRTRRPTGRAPPGAHLRPQRRGPAGGVAAQGDHPRGRRAPGGAHRAGLQRSPTGTPAGNRWRGRDDHGGLPGRCDAGTVRIRPSRRHRDDRDGSLRRPRRRPRRPAAPAARCGVQGASAHHHRRGRRRPGAALRRAGPAERRAGRRHAARRHRGRVPARGLDDRLLRRLAPARPRYSSTSWTRSPGGRARRSG